MLINSHNRSLLITIPFASIDSHSFARLFKSSTTTAISVLCIVQNIVAAKGTTLLGVEVD